ncbi:membrane protein [Betaproteobacteria bacterium]|nr:membrane protein [Betaproteobacteria bacterium]GHU01851.1 membrane protein [Betaproteobacteria bacterium]GHU10106.1 membrane protein [Betaproteobacteria bacterium]GHU17380.1 membrane protein [Betaproteobacteria bacterium]GHU22398.1 membrane protein [Betaproteobacteria bacterium]
MTTPLSLRIMSNDEYQSLVRERSAFGWWSTLLLCIVYYGFIMLIAFNKPFLATPLGEGMTTSLGIPVGFGIILFSIITTGIYVHRANTKYDAMTRNILEKEAKA